MALKKILAITAVWGKWHVDALIHANLPSLLAPNNLPYLAKRHDVEYRIYTTPADRDAIAASPAFQLMQTFLDARIETSLPTAWGTSIFEIHHDVWMRAYNRAVQERCFVLNMPPDVAFADGAGRTLCDLMDRGKKSIMWMYSRAIAETIMPVLRERYTSREGVLNVSPREFVALNLRHLHSLAMCSFAESPYFVKHPEMMLWPVKGEGLLMRTLINVNALYEPAGFKLTSNYLLDGDVDLDEIALIDDSDDLFAISLAPFGKDFDWHLYPRPSDPVRIARWWLHYDSPVNDFLVGHQMRLHSCEPTESLWRQREHRANLLLSRAVIAREALRVWRRVWALGHTTCAALIATVVESRTLLRAFPRPMTAIVFSPSDEAFNRAPQASLDELLSPRNEDRLLRFLRRHAAFDERPGIFLLDRVREAGGKMALRGFSGDSISVALGEGGNMIVDGVPVRLEPMKAGRHTVVPIEQVLEMRNTLAESVAARDHPIAAAGARAPRVAGAGGAP